MIIDVHCHVWEEQYLSEDLRAILVGIAKRLNFDLSLILDAGPERLVSEMDDAGIDKTVILGLDYEYLFKGKVSYKEYNNKVAGYINEYPDRLIGFAGIDPRRGKEAIAELERCIEELGFKGVKLWPLTGFYPDDVQFYPFYERVEDLGVTILCHTGLGPTKTYLKYNRPMYVDTVAVDFPNINIIMAHMGDPWVNEAIAVARKNPNVYLDISGLEPVFKNTPLVFFQNLFEAKMSCGIQKILFGSDWPLFTPILSLQEYIEGIKKMKVPPPMKLMGIPEFTAEESNKILGENATKLLGL
ncbi:MAG: amidohydrolase [Candidatus Lokiarchaeota archaeon]|nr:amidohydrolase [Candidatus Lokiarchaeota archaeon]